MHPSDTALTVAQRWELMLREAAWSQALRPLYRHRQRLNVIDGLSLASAELDLDGNRHDTGWIHAWTGAQADFSGTDTRSVSASIDQPAARSISRNDRLPSLERLSTMHKKRGDPLPIVPRAWLPVETDPTRVWRRVFGPSSAPDPLTTRRQGVLGYAYREYQRLSSRVSPAQRQKLQAHFELVNGLADRIEGMASMACEVAPGPPSVAGADYGERFDLLSDLIATHSPAMQLGL